MTDVHGPNPAANVLLPEHRGFGYSPAEPAALPHVSIITFVPDVTPSLRKTAESVLHQSFQQWEWLIVTGGYTSSESLAIIDSCHEKDPRIRIVEAATFRAPEAIRLLSASAQCIVLLRAGDLLAPTAVEKWSWFLESHPDFDFVSGHGIAYDPAGFPDGRWQNAYGSGKHRIGPAGMIRRAVLSTSRVDVLAGFNGREEADSWLRCLHVDLNGGVIAEPVVRYRHWPAQRPDPANERFAAAGPARLPQTVPDDLPFPNRLRKDAPRLLLIVPWFEVGGGDKFNLDLLRLFTDMGWEISIAATSRSEHPWLPEFAARTPDIFALNCFLRPADYPRFLRYLIHSRRADVVLISHSLLGYKLLPYLRSHCPETAFADFCHIEEEGGGYPGLSVAHHDFLDQSIVCSEYLRSWMVERGASSDRVAACHINVDPEEWRPDSEVRAAVRRELGVEGELPIILYAARICAQKQPRVFAQTVLRLRQEDVAFVAVVAGDGPEMPALRRFVARHKLDEHVRLLGAVSNPRVRQLMAAADIFFLPSQWEGIALSLYEAMACALPVVGADVGGQRELVTPHCGVLLPRRDEQTEAEQYALTLTGWLRDPELRGKMGKAGRSRVCADFRVEQMGARMTVLLQQARENLVRRPRPVPSLAMAREQAMSAIREMCLSEAREWLLDLSISRWRHLLPSRLVTSSLGRQCAGLVRRSISFLLRLDSAARTLFEKGSH